MKEAKNVLRIGDLVIALRKIEEMEPGCASVVYAAAGEVGQVIGLADLSFPTIRFGSRVCDCVPDVEVVRWSAVDFTVSRAVARA